MTPLIKVVLKRINFRMNTSIIIGHPADESFIKYLLKWLHQHNRSPAKVKNCLYWPHEI